MTEEINKIIKINKSKSYLLPLLNEYIQIKYLHLLENTYINIFEHVECIALLYKKDDDVGFDTYCFDISDNSLFKNYINLKYYHLFIFEFPYQFITEYKYFKLGRYSKFSQDAKKKIIQFFSNNYQYPELVQEMVHILYKNKIRKEKLEQELGVSLNNEAELTSIIDEEEETFKIDSYEY
jgi:hypothetical protein